MTSDEDPEFLGPLLLKGSRFQAWVSGLTLLIR